MCEAKNGICNKCAGNLFYRLGIRNVGGRTAAALIGHFHSISALSEAGKDELTEITDVGPVIADDIVSFFAQDDSKKLIAELRDMGLLMDVHLLKEL